MAQRLNGLFAVHKPVGITSTTVSNGIKEIIRKGLKSCHDGRDQETKKLEGGRTQRGKLRIGHGGTLDYEASGVLVIGVGKGTKALGSFLKGQKKYVATGQLGIATDTHGSNGKITQVSSYDHITEEKFFEALNRFQGQIEQVPPVYSALKVNGERMSTLAYMGVDVQPKPARPVTVYGLKCVSFEPPSFVLEIVCGGGFYVRKLIHDLGKEVDCCATMTALERTQQGPFHLGQNVLRSNEWTFERILEVLEDIQQPYYKP